MRYINFDLYRHSDRYIEKKKKNYGKVCFLFNQNLQKSIDRKSYDGFLFKKKA